jgi:uncharacterized membrane protein YbaN (DUF454 family)
MPDNSEIEQTFTDSEIKISRNRFLRWVLIITGTFLVGIGILGIFLPLLPTTIFFILAAACYARSSERFYHWLMHNRYFGKYIRDYKMGKGMTITSKIVTILILWATILLSAFFTVEELYVRILLVLIAVCVTIHLLWIKTAKSTY